MSNYKGHLAGGLFVYLVSLYYIASYQDVSIGTGLEWLLLCLAGALFPDVDIKSKGQKIFYWILLILATILLIHQRIQALMVLGVIGVIPLLVPHRGVFHRLWFVILVPVLGAWVTCSYVPDCTSIIVYDTLFFVIGAISHLWLDYGFTRLLFGKA